MDPVSLLLLGGLAMILILQFSRVRKQQRAIKQTQASIEVGAEVLTAAGMVGTVAAVGEATVTLRGPDGQHSRWVRGAVIRVLPDTDPASSRHRAVVVDDNATPGSATPGGVTGTTPAPTTTEAVDDGDRRTQD